MSEWNRSVGEIVSQIKMMETDYNGLYWLVEGPSDLRFFGSRKFECVELIVSGGKRNVAGVISALSADSVSDRILGIVDADYDWLFEVGEKLPNIVTTDPRDLEGVLLRSGALNKVLSELSTSKKIKDFESRYNCDVRSHIHKWADFFGRVRAVNDMGARVDLECLKPQRYMKSPAWVYSEEEILHEAVKLGVSDTATNLSEKMHSLPNKTLWCYVRGHDAVNILAGGLMSEIGQGGSVKLPALQSLLRAGIEEHEYRGTKLFQSIDAWMVERLPAYT